MKATVRGCWAGLQVQACQSALVPQEVWLARREQQGAAFGRPTVAGRLLCQLEELLKG